MYISPQACLGLGGVDDDPVYVPPTLEDQNFLSFGDPIELPTFSFHSAVCLARLMESGT